MKEMIEVVSDDVRSIGPQIRMMLPELTSKEGQIARYLLAREATISGLSISEVARTHEVSEAMIVKGIIALLLQVYNDSTADEIQSLPGDFLAEAGVTEMLSMNRRNGLRNVLIMIQDYASRLSKSV